MTRGCRITFTFSTRFTDLVINRTSVNRKQYTSICRKKELMETSEKLLDNYRLLVKNIFLTKVHSEMLALFPHVTNIKRKSYPALFTLLHLQSSLKEQLTNLFRWSAHDWSGQVKIVIFPEDLKDTQLMVIETLSRSGVATCFFKISYKPWNILVVYMTRSLCVSPSPLPRWPPPQPHTPLYVQRWQPASVFPPFVSFVSPHY